MGRHKRKTFLEANGEQYDEMDVLIEGKMSAETQDSSFRN
jgi:ethanolamine utilization protein EutQ (cupin superfamily)